ncbi:dethiobiotin synthase [Gellertiella hungarica]|uniref:ATP-dependent dethiobiotin synthetase BioD n=1 Tax=Gellertiella hungarica TaxID=1572859 RepID=A0A7W6J4M4_9HYPH|nr:dethiobiotin synthase [Gellertiella hungarica]MBB4064726.1 dethiobiotin synthetase [Gellertiella hungarica]
MSRPIVVTGTDTGIGKTVFSAALSGALKARYWKPVQSGLEEETDSQLVARLGGLPAGRVLPELYRLNTPASPHYAARLDGVEIDIDRLVAPEGEGPLVIEGAGGLMVPLNETVTYIDVFARWKNPVVLCARTMLGTINHTLLSLEALRARGVPVLGVAFVGDEMEETQRIIGVMGKVKILGRLPRLDTLDQPSLAAAFAANFHLADFQEALK